MATESFAHLAGRMGVDNYVRITPAQDRLQVMHDVHLGEIPAAALMARLDENQDGEVEPAEMWPYFRKAAMVYADGFDISVSTASKRSELKLRLPEGGVQRNCDARIVPGDDGAQTFRYTWNFVAEWPEILKNARQFELTLRRSVGGVMEASWQFAHGRVDNGLQVLQSNIPDSQARPLPPDITETIEDGEKAPSDRFAEIMLAWDASDGLNYADEDLGRSQKDELAGLDGVADEEAGRPARDVALRKRIMKMARSADSGWAYALLSMLCFAWGAMHAFAPGHGKAIASTYLISAKASYIHAVVLGLLMTMTHTAVILVLAAAATILKDKFVYPDWLQTVGAVLILLVGVRQIHAGLRNFLDPEHSHHGHTHGHVHDDDHNHGHSHHIEHSHDVVTAKDIGALGLSGGMVPCPAAIVLLLLTWQLGRPGFGFILIVAFSIGLAVTLISVGFLAIFGTKLILRWISKPDSGSDHSAILTSIVPFIGGVLLLVFGTIILLS